MLFPWPACSSTPLALALSLKSSLNPLLSLNLTSLCRFPEDAEMNLSSFTQQPFAHGTRAAPAAAVPSLHPKPRPLSVCPTGAGPPRAPSLLCPWLGGAMFPSCGSLLLPPAKRRGAQARLELPVLTRGFSEPWCSKEKSFWWDITTEDK